MRSTSEIGHLRDQMYGAWTVGKPKTTQSPSDSYSWWQALSWALGADGEIGEQLGRHGFELLEVKSVD